VYAVDARLAQSRREAGEFYVGPLYNDLIAKNARVKNFVIRRLYCFGTPEDLAAALKEMGD
jgi:hypothetical protein